MPPDGTMSGAPPVGSVSDVNVPQTPVMVSPGGSFGQPVDPNQVSTKPRQIPGGSGGGDEQGFDPNQVSTKPRQIPGGSGGGGGGEQGFDPTSNGSEGGPGSPLNPTAGTPGDTGMEHPKLSRRRRHALAQRVLLISRAVRASNPDLPPLEARRIAKQVVEAYPMVVQADWHGIDYGDRRSLPDSRLQTRLLYGDPKKKDPNKKKNPDEDEGEDEGGGQVPVEEHPGAAQHRPGLPLPKGPSLNGPKLPGLPDWLPGVGAGGTAGEMAAASEVAGEAAGLARFIPLLAL